MRRTEIPIRPKGTANCASISAGQQLPATMAAGRQEYEIDPEGYADWVEMVLDVFNNDLQSDPTAGATCDTLGTVAAQGQMGIDVLISRTAACEQIPQDLLEFGQQYSIQERPCFSGDRALGATPYVGDDMGRIPTHTSAADWLMEGFADFSRFIEVANSTHTSDDVEASLGVDATCRAPGTGAAQGRMPTVVLAAGTVAYEQALQETLGFGQQHPIEERHSLSGDRALATPHVGDDMGRMPADTSVADWLMEGLHEFSRTIAVVDSTHAWQPPLYAHAYGERPSRAEGQNPPEDARVVGASLHDSLSAAARQRTSRSGYRVTPYPSASSPPSDYSAVTQMPFKVRPTEYEHQTLMSTLRSLSPQHRSCINRFLCDLEQQGRLWSQLVPPGSGIGARPPALEEAVNGAIRARGLQQATRAALNRAFGFTLHIPPRTPRDKPLLPEHEALMNGLGPEVTQVEHSRIKRFLFHLEDRGQRWSQVVSADKSMQARQAALEQIVTVGILSDALDSGTRAALKSGFGFTLQRKHLTEQLTLRLPEHIELISNLPNDLTTGC